jgi:hypothetical protein
MRLRPMVMAAALMTMGPVMAQEADTVQVRPADKESPPRVAPAPAEKQRVPSAEGQQDRTQSPGQTLGGRMTRGFERPDRIAPTDIRVQQEGVAVPKCFREGRESEACK